MAHEIKRTRIEGPCPHCGRYEGDHEIWADPANPSNAWYTPCPNDECSSHDVLPEWIVRTLCPHMGVWLYLRDLRDTRDWPMGPEAGSMLPRSKAVALAKVLGGDFEAVRPYFDQVKHGWPKGSGMADKAVLDIIIPEIEQPLEHGPGCWRRDGHGACAVREAQRVRGVLLGLGICPDCTDSPNSCSCKET